MVELYRVLVLVVSFPDLLAKAYLAKPLAAFGKTSSLRVAEVTFRIGRFGRSRLG